MKTHKPCSKCGETKHLDEFWNKKGSSDGKQSQCKQCRYTSKAMPSRGLRSNGRSKDAGVKEADGFERVKVSCWNNAEGCQETRDFIIAKGGRHPRFVCSTCNEFGHERGSMLTYNGQGNSVVPQLRRFDHPDVKIYRPGDKEFAEIAKTLTPPREIVDSATKGSFY